MTRDFLIDRFFTPIDESENKTPTANLTSFGDLSMQVRRVAEVFRTNIDSLTPDEQWQLIKISKNTQAQIFLVAQHLSDLKNIDFPGKTSDELTIEDIRVIGCRYNIGPNHKYNIALTNQYGERIENALDLVADLLN